MATKYTWTYYTCPTCNKQARVSGEKPLECKMCGRTICFDCVDARLCKLCKYQITDEEYLKLKSFLRFNFVSLLFILFALFDVVCLVYLFSAVLFSNSQKIIWGGGGLFIGLLITLIINSKVRKDNAKLEQYYKSLKKNISERKKIGIKK